MKKITVFFAIIIATVAFTACSNETTVPAPTVMAATDGPGIDIPAYSVEYAYQYPKLGRWLDCNLKNRGMKKVLGYFTKKVMVPVPAKHIDGSLITASGDYAHVGDKGVVVDKTTLKNTAKVTIGSDGTVTPEASSDVDAATVKQSVTQSGFASSDSCFLGFPLLNWLIATALILLIIWLFLSIRDRNKNQPPVNNLTAGTGTAGQTVITVANNANASVNVASNGTTITHNP